MLQSDIKRVSLALPSLSLVPEQDWAEAEIRTVTPDTPHFIREGHILQHAMFILQGAVRIYKVTPQGKEITLYRVRNGESCVLMLASILGETPYEASVSIEADTEVLLIPIHLFRTWMDLYLPLKQYVFKQMIQRITSVTQLVENIAFQSIPYRIAEFLLKQIDTNNNQIVHITHEQLATELGTAREVISRSLKELVRKKIIAARRGCIQVLDRDQLLGVIHNERSM
ncbi:Crp/Fnr family transcriptional regulator [Paenibacillus sp. YPG26]|uniref:Crp/Fnr family transcriptional regulator n=1 Tax=Paenibacillus sp. YPG26 TaxID=2878915 RepID=UPI00203F10EA|nr:Crp/Fnr family transcriptional regulator [Paenibacillus sp. YPG26]USB33528.1 Crp/Fnr family transcriptional regulator [Paenibacillus sp. YPG26]